MKELITYLSGNVPGGITLYLLIILLTFFVLLFIYRVNELFTRKHFFRWMLAGVIIYTAIYAGIWLKNPPHFLYKRYSVGIFQSNTRSNWLGEYLTEVVTGQLEPYLSKKEYLFPYTWLYRISPVDSVESAKFRERIYRRMPIHKLLKGEVQKAEGKFSVRLSLYEYPKGKLLHRVEGEFSPQDLEKFRQWTRENFRSYLPFKKDAELKMLPLFDSVLVCVKRNFYQRKYKQALDLLSSLDQPVRRVPEYDRWYQYIQIRVAGEQRLKHPPTNPFSKNVPEWQKNLQKARAVLVNYLRKGYEDVQTNVLVAESYLWEENFSSAEIFLKKAYLENPFDVDILLNLSFLHPSRFQEFGFIKMGDLYQQIITLCPIEEAVLLKWSQYLLDNNPAYTAPPDYARKSLERYLTINPYSVKGWLMLGQVYSLQRSREDALAAFLKADSLKPHNGLIHFNIGVLYYEWEKYDKAEEYFKRSVEYDDYLDSHLYLGAIYKRKGEYRKALNEFRYRVAHKRGDNDKYAYQAMKGIRDCLKLLGETEAGEKR